MGSRPARVIVAAFGLWAGLASMTHAARIVDIRVGGHTDYDRLVLEIEGELRAFHQPARSGERFVLELNAEPSEPILVLETRLPRMGRVTIEGVSDGALVSVQPRPRRVRAFLLTRPQRIVIDFSSPDRDPLPIPEGAVPLVEAISPPWASPGQPEPELEPVPELTPAPVPEPLPEPLAEVPAPVPVPEPAPRLSQPLPEPTPEPPPGLGGHALVVGLAAASVAGALTLLALRLRRRWRAPPDPVREAISPDTITPEELGRGGGATEERLVALESRLDEEVRSRSRVEERLLGLHEDLKVVRDRLRRMSRQDPPGTGE